MSQKHTDKQDPNQGNVPAATNRAEYVHLIAGAEREPAGHTIHLALGIEQHPTTRLWQVWLSRTGTGIQVVSARLRAAGDGEPQPFSPETLRTIEATVWKQEQEREH